MDDALLKKHFGDFVRQYREALRIMQESVDLLELIYEDIKLNESEFDEKKGVKDQ